MLLLLQIILCCLLYLALVKCAVRDSGRNCLYFYPDAYLDEAQRRGIADKTEELRKGKRFMTFFCLVIFVVLIAVIAGWNGVKDFKTASFETYLFLVVVNWFDGFVIDLLWVGHSKIWRIGHGGRPLWEAVADGLHQAQCGHSAVPSCRGRGRRDRCADRQNLTAEEKRFPSHCLGNLFRIAARCRGSKERFIKKFGRDRFRYGCGSPHPWPCSRRVGSFPA